MIAGELFLFTIVSLGMNACSDCAPAHNRRIDMRGETSRGQRRLSASKV